MTHVAEGLAIVEYLGAVLVERLAGFEVDDPDGLGSEDNAVGTDDAVAPSNVAFIFGGMCRVEEAGYAGLLHHAVEGKREGLGGVGVEAVARGVKCEGIVHVVAVLDEREEFVYLVAVADGLVVELSEELCRLFGDGYARSPVREEGRMELTGVGEGLLSGGLLFWGVVADGTHIRADIESVGTGVEEVGEQRGIVCSAFFFGFLAIEKQFLFGAGEGDIKHVDTIHVGLASFVVVLGVEKGGFALCRVYETGG